MNEAKKRLEKNLAKIKTTSGLLLDGRISTFLGLFVYSERKYVAKQVGINYKRLGSLSHNPDPIRIQEIRTIARLYKVPSKIISEIILNQLEGNSTKSKK